MELGCNEGIKLSIKLGIKDGMELDLNGGNKLEIHVIIKLGIKDGSSWVEIMTSCLVSKMASSWATIMASS
eukprot:9429677-Ditylum_brightwellii.AAC.1